MEKEKYMLRRLLGRGNAFTYKSTGVLTQECIKKKMVGRAECVLRLDLSRRNERQFIFSEDRTLGMHQEERWFGTRA
jgi:hypothetical protein